MKKNYMFVRYKNAIHKIVYDDIIFITSMGDYSTITMCENVEDKTIHYTLRRLEEVLPKESFIRISKTQIINTDKINSIDKYSIELKYETKQKFIICGEQYRDKLYETINYHKTKHEIEYKSIKQAQHARN